MLKKRVVAVAGVVGVVAVMGTASAASASTCSVVLVKAQLCVATTTYGIQADPPGSPPQPTGNLFGFHSYISWWPEYGTDSTWERTHIQNVGGNAQRWLLSWSSVQVDPDAPLQAGTTPAFADKPRGTFIPTNPVTWAAYSNDHLYETLVANGMKPIIGVYGAPAFAAVGNNSNVPVSKYWTEFVKSVSRRYPSAIIEGYNEPNLDNDFFTPPADMARMQREMYQTVKNPALGAGQTVIGPALTDSPESGPHYTENRIPTYLNALYANGLRGYQEGMAFHPYPGTQISQFNQAFSDVTTAMAAAGDTVPLYITEVGTTMSGGWSVDEQTQNDMNVTMADSMAANPNVRAVMWMTLRDNHDHHQPPTDPNYGYGWLFYDESAPAAGRPKKVYCTFVSRAHNGAPAHNYYPQCP
jgi:Glycosyl hydrolase catalytic core